MNRKSENVNETQAAPRSVPTEDFGDVSQYRELNAIGTGDQILIDLFTIC